LTETSFHPPSASMSIGTVTINPELISGHGGPAFPQLSVPLNISIQSAEPEAQRRMGMVNYFPTAEDAIQDYTLHQIYGTLFFGSGGGQIAFHSLPLSLFSRPKTQGQVALTIALDVYQLRHIEEQRIGDLSLKFDFTFEFAKHYPVARKVSTSPIEKFETIFFSMTVIIPRSNWIDKVLPGLGYGKIYLVEIPTPERAIGGSITQTIKEFQQAQQQMLLGSYNRVLGHLRNALELLADSVEYKGTPRDGKTNPSFADKIDYLLSVLPGAPTGFRRENLARMCKDLYGFTSPPEHPSPPHFTRDDAEMTMLGTIAVLSYIGKFLSKGETASR
jgi:hypothetical protein